MIQRLQRNQKRNELIMIPIPKPKVFERKVPVGQSKEDNEDEISARQTHMLGDAIDRVSYYVNAISQCF